jgi:protein-S-isoprenylcysteine O-methyltransferase Ste14
VDSVRHVVAVFLLVSLPPGLLLWFAIHPFVRFWRRLGPGWTYAVLSLPIVGIMVALFAVRDRLLASDFGTSYPLMALAVVSAAGALVIAIKRRKLLTPRVLAGIPELSPEGRQGELLTEGIYARIRHPRYVELLLWVLGYSLFANYLALYLAFLLSLPVVYLIVVLEERELRDRFGAEYDEYRRRVPRFFPRRAGS